jgi:hypothetical protein
MKRRRSGSLLCLLSLIAGAALFQTTSVAKGQRVDIPAGRDITGTVIGISGRWAGRSRPFRLRINRYTTPDEVQRLNSALQQGEDELLKVMSGMDAGRVVIGNNVGVPANVIMATPQEAGRVKLTVLYRRDIPIFELRYGTRSSDYRFGYAEIFLSPRGNNEGTLIPAARVRLKDGNTWEVEDFGEFPARLMGLQVRGSSRIGNHARR